MADTDYVNCFEDIVVGYYVKDSVSAYTEITSDSSKAFRVF
jgi:hypothetical protein